MIYTNLVEKISSKGLTLDRLTLLEPNNEPAKISLLQCKGDIHASADGVSASQSADFVEKVNAYMGHVASQRPNLALTPEYAMPWSVVEGLIEGSSRPPKGSVWIFGCESISPEKLTVFMRNSDDVVWITELDELDVSRGGFLDPLIIVLHVESGGVSKTCICVQFKCTPMGGDTGERLEDENLIRGKSRYFIRHENSIALLPLICSDSFLFDYEELPEYLTYSYFICHLQMTPKPFYTDFCKYRTDILQESFGYRYEFLTLNWAAGTTLNQHVMSAEFGGAGYYLKPEQFNTQERSSNRHKEPHQTDDKISHNHYAGIYLKFNEESRSAAYYFNPKERVFLFDISKIMQDLSASAQKFRSGEKSTGHTLSKEVRRYRRDNKYQPLATVRVWGPITRLMNLIQKFFCFG